MSTWSPPGAGDPFVGLTDIPETGDSPDELPERRPGFWIRFLHQPWAIAGADLPSDRHRCRHLRPAGRATPAGRPGHQCHQRRAVALPLARNRRPRARHPEPPHLGCPHLAAGGVRDRRPRCRHRHPTRSDRRVLPGRRRLGDHAHDGRAVLVPSAGPGPHRCRVAGRRHQRRRDRHRHRVRAELRAFAPRRGHRSP